LIQLSRTCVSHGETDQHVEEHWSTAVRCYTPKKPRRRAKSKKPQPSWESDASFETDLALLTKVGGLQRYYDFIALGREQKEAWKYLKKAQAERSSKIHQI
jgi:hypothetical protein